MLKRIRGLESCFYFGKFWLPTGKTHVDQDKGKVTDLRIIKSIEIEANDSSFQARICKAREAKRQA